MTNTIRGATTSTSAHVWPEKAYLVEAYSDAGTWTTRIHTVLRADAHEIADDKGWAWADARDLVAAGLAADLTAARTMIYGEA